MYIIAFITNNKLVYDFNSVTILYVVRAGKYVDKTWNMLYSYLSSFTFLIYFFLNI